MKLIAAILALLLVTSSANASVEHIVYYKHHHMKVLHTPQSHPGNWTLCPTPAGIFICAVAVGIIVHEIMGPACAKPGLPNGYDTPTLWRPLCRDPSVVSVRG